MGTQRFTEKPKPPDDLERNPGIGQSAGITSSEDFEDEEGDNTVEGDVLNDRAPDGHIEPDQRGRTNK